MKTIKEVLEERREEYKNSGGFTTNMFLASMALTAFGVCYKGSNPALRIAAGASVGLGILLNTVSSFRMGQIDELQNVLGIEDLVNG